MRFDKAVYFQKITHGAYDHVTGNYAPDTVTETKIDADVTDTGIETLKLIYGSLQQGSRTIRIQNRFNALFDRIRIGNKVYKVDFMRTHRNNQVFVVSEVQ